MLFTKEENFNKEIEAVRSAQKLLLADFLTKVRNTWPESFIHRRDSIEHEEWLLPKVRFLSVLSNSIGAVEPTIDGIVGSSYAKQMTNRLISTIENIIVYTTQTVIKTPMIVKIPNNEKGPRHVKNFNLI